MKNRKAVFTILFVLLVLTVILWSVILNSGNETKVIFFDVGQGDSAFIETPDNFQILIDGGPSSAILGKLGEEMPFYDRTIDLIVLTHPDSDHLMGLLDVLGRYEVKNVLWTGTEKETADYYEWKKLLEKEEANIIIAKAGQKIILRENPEIYFLILHPSEMAEKNSNENSIVGKLAFGDNCFLFTGDISSKIEKRLVEVYGEDLDCDVLKVAHHGSKYSSSPEFIGAVSPETAVISAGENRWGHPAEDVLQRLENFGIKILITKEEGDIRFVY